jgi:predicted homoserine dehydrogenase-like protein
MNLFPMLSARAEANEPIRVAQIGAGRFDTMFLSQEHMTPGLNIAGLADLDPARARQRLKDAGWEDGRFAAGSIDDAFATGATFVTNDAEAIVAGTRIDVIIEAAGDPANGVHFARQAFYHGKSEGGLLETQGVTEVVSSLYRDGTDVPHDVAMGTYVVITSESAYAPRRFSEYNTLPDKSGTYVSRYRPTHTIGLELGVSVTSVALRDEPTGASRVCNSDVRRRSPSVHSNPAKRLMVRAASQCGIGRCRRRHRTQPRHCR